MTPLRIVEKIRALAQIGLTYGENQYDLDRYHALKKLSEELVIQLSGVSEEQLKIIVGEERGYTTPKIDTRAMIYRGDTILLVKERSDKCWTVPGGWADVGDSPAQAMLREVREESGYEAKITKLLAVYDRDLQGHPPMNHHVYKIFFLCDITGGKASASVETESAEFFNIHKLPELSLPRVTAAQILRFHEHYRHPELPSDWD